MKVDFWDIRRKETAAARLVRLNKVYGQFRPFWKRLRRITKDKRRYGFMGPMEVEEDGHPKIKYVPKHANSKRNPCPRYNQYTGLYQPWEMGQRMMVNHFYAEKDDPDPDFLFCVNDPTNPFPELVVDIDGDDLGISLGIARQIDQEVLGGKSFIEPSRGLKGAYNRFIVRRKTIPERLDDQYDAARRFNRMMLLLGRILRVKFPKGPPAHVDNVKALLWCQKYRHTYSEYIASDVFRKYKNSKYARGFEYTEALEQFILHRGVLATAACAGWAAIEETRPGDPHGRLRYDQYLKFSELGADHVPVNYIEEETVERYVERNLHLLELRDRGQPPRVSASSATHLCMSMGSTSPPPKANMPSMPVKWDDLKEVPDTFTRTRLMVIRLDQELRRCPSEEEALSKWNALHDHWGKQGFHGSETEWDTPRRIRECLKWWGEVSRHRECPFAYEQEKYLGMVTRFVRPEMVVEAKHKARSRAKITSLDLSIALYVITINTLEIDRRSELLFGTSVVAITGMFNRLKTGGISPTSADKAKVRAIKRALIAAGLIYTMGPPFRDFRDPKNGPVPSNSLSCGEQFGLGPNHDDREEFLATEKQLHDAYEYVLLRRKAMRSQSKRKHSEMWPSEWEGIDMDDLLGDNEVLLAAEPGVPCLI